MSVREPLFTDTLQISVVVRDLDAAMRTYVHDYGIGPWEIYEFNPETVRGMRERGQPVERSWRLALARVGQVQWELVEPLDDDSIYARFLAANGPGVHHIGVGVRGYDRTIAELAGRGRDVLLGGEYNGVNFSYLSTERDLGVITEIFDAPPGLEQKPDAVYPPPADS
jgi:methylmalonyl-CoA/ethylmalonyl-CoA epimerase